MLNKINRQVANNLFKTKYPQKQKSKQVDLISNTSDQVMIKYKATKNGKDDYKNYLMDHDKKDNYSSFYELSISHEDDHNFCNSIIFNNKKAQNGYIPISYKISKKNTKKMKFQKNNDINASPKIIPINRMTIQGFRPQLKPLKINRETMRINQLYSNLQKRTVSQEMSTKNVFFLSIKQSLQAKAKRSKGFSMNKILNKNDIDKNEQSFRINNRSNRFHSLQMKRKESITAWQIQQNHQDD